MITNLLLTDFNRFLSEHTGLYFPKEKWPQLIKGLAEAANELGCEDPEKCIRWLMSTHITQRQVEILAGYLTVGETYFFREKKSFDIMENIILPDLIQARQYGAKKLRIWSAACSTGEEAYSIAIVLDKKKEELKDFNILILATDINRKALKTASEGIYGEWSFRGSPPLLKDAYFTREEKKQYKIRDDLRDKVVFEYLNLVLEVRPPFLNNTNGMDIIFCRNVLMYFEPQMAKKVAAYLFRCLAPGGWLIASPTDALNISVPGLLRVDIPEAPVYRKIPGEGTMPRYNADTEATTTSGPGFDLPPPPSPASRVETAEENIPASVMSHYKEALELYRQGFYIKAAEILESLLSRPPKPMPENTDAADVMETRAFELLARTHANQGKLDTAAKWCLKAIASAKLSLQCRYLLAVIQLEQGKTEEATASLKQSLYIDPDFIPAHFALGHIAQQKKNFNEANRYFDNCLFLLNDLDPGAKVIELDKWLTAGHLKEMILILKEKVPYE